MPKHLAPLLLGLFSLALVAQTPVPPTPTIEQAANLKGCAKLGINTMLQADPYGWGYTIPSPDGTYVAQGQRLGSHGCYKLMIYQCVNQQFSGDIGCEGIFPPESQDHIMGLEWVSDNELLMSRSGKTAAVDVRAYFTPANQPKRQDKQVSLSPDGQWRIFISGRDGMAELYRSHLDGTGEERLTHSLEGEHFYGWSPDGQWMIFDYRSRHVLFANPARMRVDGSQFKLLMTGADNLQTGSSIWETLAFSLDARWLLMRGSVRDAKRDGYNNVIYRLDVPYGGVTRVTDPAFSYTFQDLAPDGRVLVWRWGDKAQERSFELIDVTIPQSTVFLVGNYAEFKGWTDDKKAGLFIIHGPDISAMNWYRVPLDGSEMQAIDPPPT